MERRRVLLITLALGLLLFVWQLGSTGLVDETPPLFAASARAMAESGDWLIPRVNGLPRYDKPPLVYWLMGLLYALPGQERWNPLGTWAASLPSALATVGVMLALADTLLRWPQPPLPSPPAGRPSAACRPAVTALTAALAFAVSPLVLLWGRIPVSDALFTALVSCSLLFCWQAYAGGQRPWWHAWLLLGLAVLTKGPVAIVLLALSLLLFAWLQGDGAPLRQRLRPAAGLLLTALVALPWYGMALLREGRPFVDSFFGYHNLQRFTSVVNHHLQPWWYFGPVLLVASLPATPLLLLGLARGIGPLRRSWRRPVLPVAAEESLGRFAACWLLAVLLFFTTAATKLPSYWLPATPAAGLLIALAAQAPWHGLSGQRWEGQRQATARLDRWAWRSTLLLTLLLSLVFLLAPRWLPLIHEPELPSLGRELKAAGHLQVAGLCFLLAALAGWLLRAHRPPLRLLALQLPLVAFVPAALLPSWSLGDRLRSLPVRQMAAALVSQARPGEPVAMVGILKPSLHYYSRRVVIYEGRRASGVVDLADRLDRERRRGQVPSSVAQQPTVLVVIDASTAALSYWQGLEPQELTRSGLYRLWRLDRARLAERASSLERAGVRPEWQDPKPERY